MLAALDGQHAQERVDRHGGPIDLLITDVVMPRMSGPELVRHLSAGWPRLKVIYMSGYSEEGNLSVTSVEDRAIVLQKPFAPSVLLSEVRTLLDRELAHSC